MPVLASGVESLSAGDRVEDAAEYLVSAPNSNESCQLYRFLVSEIGHHG